GERAPEQPAVEHEAAAREEEADRVMHELRPRVEQYPEPRADEPADRRPYDRGRGEVRIPSFARELAPRGRARGEERERQEDAEQVDRDRPDVEDVADHPRPAEDIGRAGAAPPPEACAFLRLRFNAAVRAVVQRVSEARVTLDGVLTGAIGHGLCVLLGVGQADAEA